MPLIKGKKATTPEGVSENIRIEKKAGKGQAQAVAIALDIARRAGGKVKPKKSAKKKSKR